MYKGVIVDLLTRTTQQITVDHTEPKPDIEHASSFCFCKWFNGGTTESESLTAEYRATVYEIAVIKIFQGMNMSNPSVFADFAKEMRLCPSI